jgi:hypothetical protein
MSDIFIIEVSSQAARIVVRNPDGYRFFAASSRFNPMEGQLFRNAREAERAAVRLAGGDLKWAGHRAIRDATSSLRLTAPASRRSPRIRAA